MNRVLLIYTGGTIGMGHHAETDALEPLDFNHLVDSMPEFKLIKTDIDVYQFTPPIDSSDMSPEKWAQLVRIISRNYDDYDGFVILHGTDTMAYTASALSFMLENLTSPSSSPLAAAHPDSCAPTARRPGASIELAAMKVPTDMPACRGCTTSRTALRATALPDQRDGFMLRLVHYPHLCDAGVNFAFLPPHPQATSRSL
jgi:L-asparaginase